MGRWTKAAQLVRSAMDKAGEYLTDEQAAESAALFMPWEAEVFYSEGKRLRHGDSIFKVNQDHTSAAEYPPDVQSSLYTKIELQGEYRVIPETITATEAFGLGEKGWWKDVLYESLRDGNVHTPEQYPDGWKEVTA